MMTTRFLNALKGVDNYALTENGAVAKATTNSAVLDFFSQGGAIRMLSPEKQQDMFLRAWAENPELALKAMFYFRDVRGGQGQREAFRNQYKLLAELAEDTARKNISNIPEYGRWDDVYALDGTEVERDAYDALAKQFNKDMFSFFEDDNISLLAKWLKSENASSRETKRLARKTREALGMDSRSYRKALSKLRKHLDVVERKTSANQWDEIEYSRVPSNAMMKYRNAFAKHDRARYTDFINAVNTGEAKINVSVLYPHEIVGKIMRGGNIDTNVAEAMWNNLPDFTGEAENSIAVVDTSGSMGMGDGLPRDVALGLGIYLAERAKGPYKDHFITFSNRPKLQELKGANIVEKVNNLWRASWDMNTNIEAVFNLVLDAAIKNNVPKSEMLDKLYIISDMEFDGATSRSNSTLFQTIADKFSRAGYEMPKLVFWNVNARNVQFPMSMDERGFQNVSGFSPSILQSLMTGEFIGPYELMLEVLNSERYKSVTL
jgi:hypothetical protein